MKAVVDANVWLAASRPEEPSHREAAAFLREAIAQGVELLEPVLVLPEVAGTAARSSRDATEGREATERLAKTPGVQFYDVTCLRAERAAGFASRLFLKGADSVYAVLAAELGTELVTLDLELHQRAGAELPALSPTERLARHAPAQA